MDQVGLDWVLNLSGRWPQAGLEQQLAAAKQSGRILVACQIPWRAAAKLKDFPELAAQLIHNSQKMGARALKIHKALGLVVQKYDGKLLKVDDPWLDPIWKAAGEAKLPIFIHTGDPKAFWEKPDHHNERFEELSAHPSWSNYGLPVPSFQQLLDALMRVVARHPKTNFVAVHFGNNSEDPFWVARMLDKYPNLYVDLAARIVELGRQNPEKLRQVFIKHHQKILFGTDLGVSPRNYLMLGSHGEEPNNAEEVSPYFEAHWRWLETAETMPSPTPIQGRWDIYGLYLPKDVLRDIYLNNALKLLGKPPWGAKLWGDLPPYFREKLD